MSNDVDLRQLAVDRGGRRPSLPTRRHLLSRYVLPLALLSAFAFLVAWAARDVFFPPRPVKVVPVHASTAGIQRQGTPLFQAAGWIEPRPTPIHVAALAPGVVQRLLVVEDQLVSAGQPIAELVKDDAQLSHNRALAELQLHQAELEQAKAELTAARTRYEQPVHLTAPLAEADATLAQLQTELANLPFQQQRADADLRARQIDYQAKSAARGVVAGVDIDRAEAKVAAAQALVEELQDRAKSLVGQQKALQQRRDALQLQLELLADETKAFDQAQAKVAAAQAQVARACVAVAEAKLQLDRMTIVAPVDGRIYRLIAHPGTRLGSGAVPVSRADSSTVVTMYRPDMLQARVDVRFEDIPKVSLNQPVEINNPALAEPRAAKVLFISSEADIQKNTLQVKVEIPEPPAVFKPEMLVDVTFLTPRQAAPDAEPQRQTVLFVLPQLIHRDAEGPFVWLADQSERVARKTPVQIGNLQSNGLVEVTEGLTVSSRIISTGTENLSDGHRIQVTGEDPLLDARQTNDGPSSPAIDPPGGTP